MRGSHRLQIAVGFGLFAFCCPTTSAYVQPIAWYRLGEDDPGAAAGNIGNDPTQDHTINNLDLARNGSPRYSDDTPPNSYINSTLSMFFPNWGGPIVPPAYLPSYYSRTSPVNTSTDNIGLECWVKSGTTVWQPDPTGYALIAYNGNPFSNGFGFFQHGKNYVVRVGSYEKVLAPASTTTW